LEDAFRLIRRALNLLEQPEDGLDTYLIKIPKLRGRALQAGQEFLGWKPHTEVGNFVVFTGLTRMREHRKHLSVAR